MTAPTLAPDAWATALLAAAMLTPDAPELPAEPATDYCACGHSHGLHFRDRYSCQAGLGRRPAMPTCRCQSFRKAVAW